MFFSSNTIDQGPQLASVHVFESLNHLFVRQGDVEVEKILKLLAFTGLGDLLSWIISATGYFIFALEEASSCCSAL